MLIPVVESTTFVDQSSLSQVLELDPKGRHTDAEREGDRLL
jgi:hypothetical protein